MKSLFKVTVITDDVDGDHYFYCMAKNIKQIEKMLKLRNPSDCIINVKFITVKENILYAEKEINNCKEKQTKLNKNTLSDNLVDMPNFDKSK